LEEPVGPVLEVQLTPFTPDMLQVAVPVGVVPAFGPVTVAVKVKVEPRVVVGVLVETATVGVLFVILRVNVVLGPAEL